EGAGCNAGLPGRRVAGSRCERPARHAVRGGAHHLEDGEAPGTGRVEGPAPERSPPGARPGSRAGVFFGTGGRTWAARGGTGGRVGGLNAARPPDTPSRDEEGSGRGAGKTG